MDFKQLHEPHKAKQRMLNALFASAIAFIAFLICWAFFKAPSLRYDDLPWAIAVDRNEFKPGETVPLYVSRCNLTDKPILYTVTRGLKNIDTGEMLVFNATHVFIEPGCKRAISRLHALPSDMAPGRYQIVGFGSVADVLSSRNLPFESEPFTVR